MRRTSEMAAYAPVEVQTGLHSNESMTTDRLMLFSCLDILTSVPHTSVVASHKLFSQIHWLLYHSQHLSLSLLLCLPVMYILSPSAHDAFKCRIFSAPLHTSPQQVSSLVRIVSRPVCSWRSNCLQCHLCMEFLVYVTLRRFGIMHTHFLSKPSHIVS